MSQHEIITTKTNDESGSIGIGAMIVFIALILVAAVASTVIIKTAEELQDRAEKTGDDTRDQISGKLIVTDAYVATVSGTPAVTTIQITVKLSSGSDATATTAMSWTTVGQADAGTICTDTGLVSASNMEMDALTPLGAATNPTSTPNSGEQFIFTVTLNTCDNAIVGSQVALTLNVGGGGDTRVGLEIETLGVGDKLI
jgi:flagellin FlaB